VGSADGLDEGKLEGTSDGSIIGRSVGIIG
jgi:hypothetical protein